MQRYLLQRILLVIPTLWLVVSLLFLALRALPGDFVTRKLSNLENQGAEQRESEITGYIEVEETLHRVISGDTLESIAADNSTTVSELLATNPDLDTSADLRPGTRVAVIPGRLLETIAVAEKVSLPEEAQQGVQLLIDRNPDIDFPLYQGKPYAEAGTILTIRTSLTLEELAHVNRIEAGDILAVNPTGSASNPDGNLTADTQLVPTSLVIAEEGDTLEGIAVAFGRDVDDVTDANRGIDAAEPLEAGKEIVIPSDKIVTPTTKITEANIRNRLGIDKPLGTQYIDFLWETVRLKFRPSFQTQEGSLDIFLRALPRTLHLNVYSLIVALIIALPVGILSAMRQDRPLDYALRGFAILALAAPSFWIATMLIFVVTPGGISESGIWSIPLTSEEARSVFSSFTGALALYSIPAIAGGIAAGAGLMRITRSELLEVLRQDYVRTAWSKGLRERTVIRRHAMRNALVNVMSVLGLQIAALVGGNIILELLFNIPGIGLLLIQRINQADLPVVQTMVFFFALFIIVVNIIIDISYAVIDPRIRYT
ncbi:MAG: ABC transporter permease subunit [Chloroflexota bacterium]|nr:ABC transporter permease subunit [Chloroflexota bacterium]MDE2890921.1 ABC transporter permease subunit [Chloroflexota bacterium]